MSDYGVKVYDSTGATMFDSTVDRGGQLIYDVIKPTGNGSKTYSPPAGRTLSFQTVLSTDTNGVPTFPDSSIMIQPTLSGNTLSWSQPSVNFNVTAIGYIYNSFLGYVWFGQGASFGIGQDYTIYVFLS